MTSQLIASFDNTDAAELAVSKLRRSGLSFTVLQVSPAARQADNDFPGSTVNVVYPYDLSSVNPLGSVGGVSPLIGARAMLNSTSAPEGEVQLRVKVEKEDLTRAREILRSAHGLGICAY